MVPIHVRQQREEARRTAHQSHSLNDEAATELSTSSAAPSQNNSNPYLTNEGQLHFARRGSPSPGRKSQDNGDGAAEDDSDAPAFPYCEECFVPLYPDPKPSQLYIYLHALRYAERPDPVQFVGADEGWLIHQKIYHNKVELRDRDAVLGAERMGAG